MLAGAEAETAASILGATSDECAELLVAGAGV